MKSLFLTFRHCFPQQFSFFANCMKSRLTFQHFTPLSSCHLNKLSAMREVSAVDSGAIHCFELRENLIYGFCTRCRGANLQQRSQWRWEYFFIVSIISPVGNLIVKLNFLYTQNFHCLCIKHDAVGVVHVRKERH
jgi:hypothetical protein